MPFSSDPAWGSPRTPEQMGRVIAARRRQLQVTQGELADQAGVPRRFVNDLETGDSTMYVRRLFATLDTLGFRLVLEPAEDADEIEAPSLKDIGW